MSVIEKIETSVAYLCIEGDVLYMTIKQNAEIDETAAKEIVESRIKLQQGKSILVLLDSGELHTITRGARAYFSEHDALHNLNKAMAMVSTSLPTRLFANFFIKFNKPFAPTKLFQVKSDGLEWLKTFR